MSEYRKWYAGNHHMITEAAHNSVVELEQQLAELRDAVNVYLNLEDCMSLEALEALLPEEVDDE